MKYLPFEKICYQTRLTPEVVLNKIQENTELPGSYKSFLPFRNDQHKPYEGKIAERSFTIYRITGYRNSFRPIISGYIENDNQGTKIKVKMRLRLGVLVFLCFWFTGVGLTFIAGVVSAFQQRTFEPIIFIPFGMLLFVYGLTTAAFKYESAKSKKQLAELWEAEIKAR